MSKVATYSPEDVIITLGGIYTVEGLAEGEFVSISKETRQFNSSVTADGRVSRTKVEDPTHLISITLASYSDSNLVFTSWAEADALVASAMLPLFIKDAMGSTMFYAPMCWIESTPATTFDIDVGTREWTIRAAGGVLVTGGNQSGNVLDTNLAKLGFIAADFGGLF